MNLLSCRCFDWNPSSLPFLSNYLSFVPPHTLTPSLDESRTRNHFHSRSLVALADSPLPANVMHPAKNSVLPLDSEMQDSCSVTQAKRVTGIRAPFSLSVPDERECVCVYVCRERGAGIECSFTGGFGLIVVCGSDSSFVLHSLPHAVSLLCYTPSLEK